MTALETTITSVATRCLRGDRCDPDTPFELLGLDSLATIELAAALEDELGCDLPADLLLDCTDVRSLAARLAELGLSEARRPNDPFEQMFADAVLPDDVWPAGSRVHADRGLREARTILLTGATGFLGSALLEELLETPDATILCLARQTSREIATRHAGRVRTILGDLSQPRLGLSEATYDALIRQVDAVCHAAATVNWVFSYAGLRGANVLGTLEVLRLASRAGAPFHFISSLSTCYSTLGERSADEAFDALPALRGIHLGYAQTKVVGEALVRQAGERGLPVRIYRPALISGDSRTGAFNRDDLISALVRGCVHMKTAPDLDWKLDCEPVDRVARAIVSLSGLPGDVFHLGHRRPRHWRECVLWMRTYGYDVRLVSYHAWLRQLERETLPSAAASSGHPLRPLRSFFLDRPAGAHGLTMPELYEESRRTRAVSERTQASLSNIGVQSPALDATLLETYFGAFRAAGDLPDPAVSRTVPQFAGRTDVFDTGFLSRTINAEVHGVEVLSSGSEHSIISELTAWRSKRACGLFRARLSLAGRSQDAFIKVKAHDSDVMAVGESLADLVDPAVGRAYRTHSGQIGFAASHVREIAIYRQTDPRVTRHVPRVLGTAVDDEHATWVAVLEDIRGAKMLDSADRPEAWGPAEIGAALDGLAALHAVWLGRDEELQQQPWIGHVPTARSVAAMADLWTALADHAAPYFSGWADPDIVQIHQRLVATAGQWWQALEAGPRTLIHHDFNPRNICLRADSDQPVRLCAYDWELATLGAPQRDLAEFLCFVLTDGNAGDAARWVEHHRLALERESGRTLDVATWNAGFRSALCDVLIDRLAIYAVVHRVRRQSFLPRVVCTWLQLYREFPRS